MRYGNERYQHLPERSETGFIEIEFYKMEKLFNFASDCEMKRVSNIQPQNDTANEVPSAYQKIFEKIDEANFIRKAAK